MFVPDEEVTALRAELERAKKDLARIRREGETMKQKKLVREASERTVVGHILRQARR